MADVFISYKRENRAVAEAIDTALRASGYSTWWDTSLIAGEHFNGAIERELAAARCVLVLWTEASHASQWVQAEAIEGFNRQLLVAARLDEVALKYPFGIVQTADLRGYQPGATHEGIEQIIEGVSAKVGRAPAAPAPIADAPIAAPVRASAPETRANAPKPLRPTPRPTAASDGGLSTTVLVFGLLVATFAASVGRYAPITMILPIGQEFHLATSQLAILTSSGPLLLGIVVGVVLSIIADASRASRGWIIVGGLALCAATTILQAQAQSVTLFFLGRFIAVASAAATLPIGLSLLYDKAERWLTTLIALIAMGVTLGAGLSTTLAGFLTTALGWRTALASLGDATLVLAAIAALLLFGVARDPRLSRPSGQRPAYGVGNLLALLAGYAAAGSASQALSAFATIILNRDLGMSVASVGVILAVGSLGAVVVSIIASLVADANAQRNRLFYSRVAAGGAFVAALATTLYAFAPDVLTAAIGFGLAVLAMGAITAPVFAAMRYGVAGRWWATIAALFSLGYYGVGALGPPIAGFLMGIGGRAQTFVGFAVLLSAAGVLFLVASSGTARPTGDDIADVF